MIQIFRSSTALQQKAAETAPSGDTELVQTRACASDAFTHSAYFSSVWKSFQNLRDFRDYQRTKAQLGSEVEEFYSLFKKFLAATVDRKCLRMLFDTDAEQPLGPNWVTLDLASVERKAGEIGAVSIDLADQHFDTVLCTGLERVSHPTGLIAEARRVLKHTGQIWVQAPLNSPYRPMAERDKAEYWRITPEGLRVLMKNFEEIFCTVFLPNDSSLRNTSFYYGLKPPEESLNASQSALATQPEVEQSVPNPNLTV